MATMTQLCPPNDYEFRVRIRRMNELTGLPEPAIGLQNLWVRLSDTAQGAAIDQTLQVAVTERANRPGFYSGILTGAAQAAQLGTRTRCWRVFGNGTTIVRSTRMTILSEVGV